MTRAQKRSISIDGHRTSISLEPAFWDALQEIARAGGSTLAALVGRIDHTRGETGLSGALRVHVLEHYRRAARATSGKPRPAQ